MAGLKERIDKPKDVTINTKDNIVTVTGKLGVLEQEMSSYVILDIKENNVELIIDPSKSLEESEGKRILGLYSELLSNMVTGVSNGFEKKLQIIGVGYKVLKDIPGVMEFELGFSHPIFFILPKWISYDIVDEKNSDTGIVISIKGIDKYLVGQVASLIRDLRRVEPYKGKGIRYFGETIKLKEKKTTK